ncbi:NAD-dependent protein deacetylase sirtuin-2-like isoform X2 [Ostrea edulis]|nr:NAD-dependent protein deacetylase sirtuin-2-like isoform X2 [Ostrea edulis]
MAGAGISTSAGIPDFRSPKTGLYDNLEKFNLPNPQAIFSLDYFKENPVPYFTVRKEMLLGNYKPTPCHYFIRMLAERGLLLRHYTQNIDGLERIAGIDPDMMVEAHGSNRVGHCLDCSAEYTHKWIKNILRRDQIPKCSAEGCSGIIKPDTVFFGQRLPSRFFELTDQDFEKCDLLIILGTSLKVQPFAKLPINVPDETPRLYINMEKNVSGSKHPLAVLVFGGGFKFDEEDNYRDVFLQSPCDEGCSKLADLLGWGDELRYLVTKEHAKLEQEFKEEEQHCAIEASVSVTKVSVITTQVPVSSTQVPVSSTQVPVSTTQVPVSSTQVPVSTTQAPISTTQNPVRDVKSSSNKSHNQKTSQIGQKEHGTKMKPNASRNQKSAAKTRKK